MPYSDQWGLTVTKTGAGVYAVSRLGVSGTVTITDPFPNARESINVSQALWRACYLMMYEREGVGDGNLSTLWRLRAEYAYSRWKLQAYARLILDSSGATRTACQAKRDRWTTEDGVRRTALGTDA